MNKGQLIDFQPIDKIYQPLPEGVEPGQLEFNFGAEELPLPFPMLLN